MIDIKIAFRNIFRNKRRTFITIACIVAGICSIIIIGGYYEFNYYGLRESLINSQYAHVQIYKKGFLENEEIEPFRNVITNADEIIDFLKMDKRVKIISPRVQFWGVLSTLDGKTKPVKIRGVIPKNESLINTFILKRVGKELNEKQANEIEIGNALAKSLDIGVDQYVILTTITADGFQNAIKVKVGGITGSFSSEYDSILVKMHMYLAQELVTLTDIQEIVVLLDKTEITDTFIKYLKQVAAEKSWDLEITSWYERSGYYRSVVEYYQGYFRIILFIVCIVSFFTTLNTMVMAVLERFNEIGTMRSFGVNKKRVFKIFILEALFIGIIGFALGILISYIITWIIAKTGGIYNPPPPGASSGFYAKIMIVSSNIVISGTIALFVPVIASVISIVKMSGMTVIEQLYYNNSKK
ncbi:MAG: ABC transporter permease [Spirochaetales bacterium]|nr:ABC transporter permease [Spirochaetales bacterium]